MAPLKSRLWQGLRHCADAACELRIKGMPPGKLTLREVIENQRFQSPPTSYEESFNSSEIHFYVHEKVILTCKERISLNFGLGKWLLSSLKCLQDRCLLGLLGIRIKCGEVENSGTVREIRDQGRNDARVQWTSLYSLISWGKSCCLNKPTN